MHYSKISGLGHYVPEQVVSNEALTEKVNTTDAWIQERTGIQERRYADVKNGEQKLPDGGQSSQKSTRRRKTHARGYRPHRVRHA